MNYRLNEEKMFMDISDGIAVVINSETGIYYGMNGFGTMVFDAITKGMAIEDIQKALKELSNSPADIENRLSVFVSDLLKNELIIKGSQGTVISFDEDIAKADDFVLTINSYDDAQEMLLADPIHEVKEETGWTPEKESIGYSKEETRKREQKVQL